MLFSLLSSLPFGGVEGVEGNSLKKRFSSPQPAAMVSSKTSKKSGFVKPNPTTASGSGIQTPGKLKKKGKRYHFVKPWDPSRPYRSPDGKQILPECKRHFDGFCLRCGHNSHVHARCKVYPDHPDCSTLCGGCNQGFHPECRRVWVREQRMTSMMMMILHQLSLISPTNPHMGSPGGAHGVFENLEQSGHIPTQRFDPSTSMDCSMETHAEKKPKVKNLLGRSTEVVREEEPMGEDGSMSVLYLVHENGFLEEVKGPIQLEETGTEKGQSCADSTAWLPPVRNFERSERVTEGIVSFIVQLFEFCMRIVSIILVRVESSFPIVILKNLCSMFAAVFGMVFAKPGRSPLERTVQ